jgi:hypothetical protein
MVLTSVYIVTSPFKYNFIKNWYSQMHAYKALDYFLAHPQTRQISSEQNRGITNGDVGLSKKKGCQNSDSWSALSYHLHQ